MDDKNTVTYLYRCKYCATPFSTAAGLINHKKEVHYRQIYEEKKLKKLAALASLQQTNVDASANDTAATPVVVKMEPLECDDNPIQSPVIAGSSNNHVSAAAGNESAISPNQIYKCKFCIKSFRLHINLVDHQKTHSQFFNFMNQPVSSATTAVQPEDSGNVTPTTSSSSLETNSEPIQLLQSQPRPMDKEFNCSLCPAAFSSLENKQKHERIKHSDIIGQVQASAAKETIGNNSNDVTFDMINTSSSPRKTTQESGKQSRKMHHFNCNQCGKTLKTNYKLYLHIQSVHTKPYLCPHCPHRSGNSTNHNTHLRIHDPNVTKDYKHRCKLCSGVLADKSALRRHYTISHKITHDELSTHSASTSIDIDIKPSLSNLYRRNDCSETITSKQYYYANLKTANDEKAGEFECYECDKVYQVKASLLYHILKQHRDQYEKYLVTSTSTSSKERSDEVRNRNIPSTSASFNPTVQLNRVYHENEVEVKKEPPPKKRKRYHEHSSSESDYDPNPTSAESGKSEETSGDDSRFSFLKFEDEESKESFMSDVLKSDSTKDPSTDTDSSSSSTLKADGSISPESFPDSTTSDYSDSSDDDSVKRKKKKVGRTLRSSRKIKSEESSCSTSNTDSTSDNTSGMTSDSDGDSSASSGVSAERKLGPLRRFLRRKIKERTAEATDDGSSTKIIPSEESMDVVAKDAGSKEKVIVTEQHISGLIIKTVRKTNSN